MIELRSVTKIYGHGPTSVTALQNVSATVNLGEFVAIMGPSGSGKSTLLNLIGCLDSPSSGEYLLQDRSVNSLDIKSKARLRNEVFGFVFQSFNLLPDQTALENVMLPLRYSRVPKKLWKSMGQDALATFGLEALADRYPDQLSGGQQQRIAIARALVNNPQVILADEPTGNLDSATGREIIAILQELASKHQKLVIVVTHDAAVASQATRLWQLVDGRIIDDTPLDSRAIMFAHPTV